MLIWCGGFSFFFFFSSRRRHTRLCQVTGVQTCALPISPAIEGLGRIRTVLLDKTGTLTLGAPAVERVLPADGVAAPDLLRLAASVDQLSPHVMAEALVHDAEGRGLALADARDVHEQPGDGIEGTVEGRRV